MTQRRKTRRRPVAKRRVAARPRGDDDATKNCVAPKCGRPLYARELCQTHHRMFLDTGELQPIRPYRPRRTETIKFGGLRLRAEAANHLDELAEQRHQTRTAVMTDVLEAWVRRGYKLDD